MKRVFWSALFAFSLLCWQYTQSHATTMLWYEPSNGQQPGGNLPDFLRLFDDKAAGGWTKAQRGTDVLLLRIGTLRNVLAARPDFLSASLAPFLSRTGMKFGIDTGLPNFGSCEAHNSNRDKRLKGEVALLRRIENAGIRIAYISLQSTLSKVHVACPGYSLEARSQDIAWYITQVRSLLAIIDNSTRFGLIDASVAKGPAWVQKHLGVGNIEIAYQKMLEILAGQGVRLEYLHFDHPWEAFQEFNPKGHSSFTSVRNVQVWLERRGVTTGILLSSTRSSNEGEFCDRVLQVLREFTRIGAPGRHFVLAAWKQVPAMELPEDPVQPGTCPMTHVLNQAADYVAVTYKKPEGLRPRPQ